MKKKRLSILLVSIISLVWLAGCVSTSSTQSEVESAVVEAGTESSSAVQTSTDSDSAEVVTVSYDQEDAEVSFDESDAQTEYSAASSTINLSDYAANSVVTITAAGEYVLSGSLADGQVVVNVGDDDEVQLYLNNAQITNDSGSAILVENAAKVVITLNNGTVNTVSDGVNYTDLGDDGDEDAAIFSHDDLTINGSGSLTVYANYSDGIESRDDLKISGGYITVTSVDAGLFGNNSLEIESAVLVITSDGDTVHSDGDILIESGTLTLNSGDDGIHADGTLTINDGTIDVQQSYEGLEATDVIVNGGTIDIVASDDGINGAGGNDSSAAASTNDGRPDNFSNSSGSITINGGTIMITAATSGTGDGLDANGTIVISGGDIVIKMPSSYRDYSSIDYDTSFSLTGGNVRILETDGTYTQVTSSYVSTNPGAGGGGRGGRP